MDGTVVYGNFEWDKSKAAINKRNHGVDFVEAASAFYDPNGILIYDPDHSKSEHRYILLGLSYTLKLLVISHCYRGNEERIRLISAREAVKKEEVQYGR